MAEDVYRRLARKKNIGSVVRFDRVPVGEVEDEISRLESAGEYKNFLQRIRLYPKKAKELKSQYAYRWCYWVVNGRGTLSFGQFALVVPPNLLRGMLADARKRGWHI